MSDQVARPATYGEIPAATVGIAIPLYFLITQGLGPALEVSPLAVIGLLLGAWTVLMRLRFSPTELTLTIGPWRRSVDLQALESIHWKMTGGWLSRGTIYLGDRRGGRVPIWVGRFKRRDEWAPLLLQAAARTDAVVDSRARELLDEASQTTRGDAAEGDG